MSDFGRTFWSRAPVGRSVFIEYARVNLWIVSVVVISNGGRDKLGEQVSAHPCPQSRCQAGRREGCGCEKRLGASNFVVRYPGLGHCGVVVVLPQNNTGCPNATPPAHHDGCQRPKIFCIRPALTESCRVATAHGAFKVSGAMPTLAWACRVGAETCPRQRGHGTPIPGHPP